MYVQDSRRLVSTCSTQKQLVPVCNKQSEDHDKDTNNGHGKLYSCTYIAIISQHSEPGTNIEGEGNLGQNTCIHVITCFIFNVHCFSPHTTAGDDQEKVMMNLIGDDKDETLLGQSLSEQGDDSALGSTGNFAHLHVYIISSIIFLI